ncbi:SET domain-containing protein [Streptomyces litchfieldiae]|uniref:SET domain-containing protein-lysine N-methyltransferase n=1 Tax=Streptomyces litchfieldiae TaxID=3075543 RepID=A0ABU2N126_9ACTN|nr:SET domain-containing protein-lysine N-methyltransferase [Streptomyces sp. DSM 44938]MDT0346464.1 SET domain-containing protein-lysine N-methyltransferase [Streptomyces sp. DSM 44938]
MTDAVPPEPDCWLHPDIEPRPSPIAGTGLFARARVPAGTVVSRLGGRLVSWPELDELFAEAARLPDAPFIDTITVTETAHLVLPPRRANGYGNHSCDPNTWWAGDYGFAARRDIAAGEEVTSDYATTSAAPDFSLTCSCGSPRCRGLITAEDWRLPELQERYGDHWVPALAARIARGA